MFNELFRILLFIVYVKSCSIQFMWQKSLYNYSKNLIKVEIEVSLNIHHDVNREKLIVHCAFIHHSNFYD